MSENVNNGNGNPSKSKKALLGDTALSPPAEALPEAGQGNGATPTPNGGNVVAMPTPDRQGGESIPDPGDDEASAYTSTPSFAGRQGVRRKTSILLQKPKEYCRTLYSMAARQGMITVINVARADAMNPDLRLIQPHIANDDELMHDVVGAFEVLSIPCLDRYGIPYLWNVRQCSNDGREISSFAGAIRAAQFAEDHWTLIQWGAGDWEYDEHRNPSRIHAEWPKALKRYDDWLENGFPGKIIRAGDDDILETARGKR